MTQLEALAKIDHPKRQGAPFVESFRVNPETGCWDWIRNKDGCGYGFYNQGVKHLLAHRVSYVACKGPIPVGLVIDHLCRNQGCVNPYHLEAVTVAENNRRAVPYRKYQSPGQPRGWRRANPVQFCKHGHPFDELNTCVVTRRDRNQNQERHCRVCVRDAQRRCRAKRKANQV